MDFAPGTRLGPYGLVSTPGAREMGEIRERSRKLTRQRAVKHA